MTCYIWGAGDPPVSFPRPTAGDLVIAADAGLSACHAAGVMPSVTIGDFDSLGEVPTEGEVIRLPVEKDETDMAVAVRLGRARGADRFILFGGAGGRPDHTYANYQLLADLAARKETGYLIGRDYSAAAIADGTALTFPDDFRGGLSVFCVSDVAHGVYESGVQYPLTDATLTSAVPLGVSNRVTAPGARVSVEQGTLLLMWEGQVIPSVTRTQNHADRR